MINFHVQSLSKPIMPTVFWCFDNYVNILGINLKRFCSFLYSPLRCKCLSSASFCITAFTFKIFSLLVNKSENEFLLDNLAIQIPIPSYGHKRHG